MKGLLREANHQAPKSNLPGAKQSLVLSYIQNSLTVHSLKELEKALPSVASINSMQVKEYLQALTDEGTIRVEKIGSGNWYWSFLSEDKRTRLNTLEKLRDEKEKLDSTIVELKVHVDEATNRREEDGNGREALVVMHAKLTEEVLLLNDELNGYKDSDPGELTRKRVEIEQYKEKAYRWTENLELLEGWLTKVTGGDKERIEDIKRMFYGDQYAEGEGLKEL